MHDRHPAVIAEVRGEGLLLGLRALVPAGELVDRLRGEGLLTVAAGENVVRLVPPLVVTEAELGEAMARLDRAATRIEEGLSQKQKLEAAR
jgi:acetylornithine/N-succinyldiaminopimelate aminotransferase